MKKTKQTRIIIFCLCAVFVLGIFASCGEKVTVESLLNDGKYQEAYDKGDQTQKGEIAAETAVAAAMNELISNNYSGNALKLKSAYYNDGSEDDLINTNGVVLCMQADENDSGKTGYVLMLYSESSGTFVYNTATYSLEKDDDTMKNMYRSTMRNIMDNGIELDKKAIERVQSMYENNTLSAIEFIENN